MEHGARVQISCSFNRAIVLLVSSTLFLSMAPTTWAQQQVSEQDIARIHQSLILIDTHNDITSRTVDGFDIGSRAPETHTDLHRLREGGVDAVFFAAYVAASYERQGRSAHRALQMIDTIRHDIIARYPLDFVLAFTASDIERAARVGKIAALIGLEGGHAIEDDLRLLRAYYDLGVRYMTLTHVNTNNWADSSGDIDDPKVKHHGGLTDFGRQVVLEMNRLGMIVDISHVSDDTFWDVLEVSKAPVFASHSSCRALSNIPRNMSDEMIRAMAQKGGVIQINFGCDFLSQKTVDARKKLSPIYTRRRQELRKKFAGDPERLEAELKKLDEEYRSQIPRATLADVVAHIDHVVKIAGIDAVGIGSDFDGVSCTPVGLSDVSEFPNLTRALLERGYTVEDLRKIYGGNTLRLMREVERVARQMQQSRK